MSSTLRMPPPTVSGSNTWSARRPTTSSREALGLSGALLAPRLAGVTVVLQERFAPEETLRAIGRHRVTVFPGVATMFARILESPALDAADLSSLRLAVSGAAPCPWTLASEWRRRTRVRILPGYGVTELVLPTSYLAADATRRP